MAPRGSKILAAEWSGAFLSSFPQGQVPRYQSACPLSKLRVQEGREGGDLAAIRTADWTYLPDPTTRPCSFHLTWGQ